MCVWLYRSHLDRIAAMTMDWRLRLGFLFVIVGISSFVFVDGRSIGRPKYVWWEGRYGYGYFNGHGRPINKAPTTTVDTLKDPISKFSVSLFKISKPDGDPNGNKFMSPFSVMAALMLTMLGTSGNTESQIMSALQLNGVSGNVHQEYKELQDYLNTALTNDDIIISIANRLFPKLGFALRQQYKVDAERYYGSEVEPLDFIGQPEASRLHINEWASNKTNNLIKNILPKGSITRASIMFLVNAIYFKGSWKLEFNKTNTKESDFYITPTLTEKVDMMNMKTDKFRSGMNTEYDCTVLELPYKGEDFKMLIILPNKIDGVADLENKLSADTLASIAASLRKQDTTISIPKFEMLSGFKNLVAPLKQLGITDLFSGLADFSNMFVNPSGLMVDKVIHKAFVRVDEEGTEAAAVTVVGVVRTSLPLTLKFNANHPFIFLIQEKRSGAILFMGRYAKKQ